MYVIKKLNHSCGLSHIVKNFKGDASATNEVDTISNKCVAKGDVCCYFRVKISANTFVYGNSSDEDVFGAASLHPEVH